MKRAYLADGTLAAQVSSKDSIFLLDSSTWAYLNGLLGTDYCYLVIGAQEIVKVQGLEAPNIALVIRGLEGTDRTNWPDGTSVGYTFTQSEMTDATEYVGYSLNAVYPILNNGGVLSYDEMQIVGIGGITVDGDDEGIWMIQDIPANAGCYNPLAPGTPPPIPLTYYNLRIVTEGYYRTTVDGAYREYK